MKRYKVFHPFVLSFFSKSLYQDIAQNWKGSGFLYLFLLVLICSIPITVKFHLALSDVPAEIDPVIQQIPDITLKNGTISIQEPQPYFINDPSQQDSPVIIIDTTGKYTSLEGTDARVLVTGTKVFAKDRIYDLSGFSEIEKFTVTKEGIGAVIKIFCDWFALISFPFFLIFLYLFRIVHVLIFSVIGLLFAKILKVSLIFGQIMRLTAAAITPVIIAHLIVSFGNGTIPFWFRLGITLGYLFYAIKVNARNNLSHEGNVETTF